MNKRRQATGILLLLVMVFLVACAPKAAPAPQAPAPAAPAPAPAPAAAQAPAPAAPARPAWQMEWEKTLEAAQKEGQLVQISQLGPALRQALNGAFKSKSGIGGQSLTGRSSELIVKIMAERRAGIFTTDVGMIGHVAPYDVLKPAGALESLDKVLFLPELTDPQEIRKVWRLGELEWVDEGHTIIVFTPVLNVPLVVNTQLVKPGEIKGYRDLLKPEWKGKVVISDPTLASGPGTTWAQEVGTHIMSWDYLRQLVEQEPLLTRDVRLGVEWVARGKYAVGIALDNDIIKEFTDIGAPLLSLIPSEGPFASAAAGTIILLKDAPHPNIAKLFINWLLSKEGQTVYAKARGTPSGRLDVPTEGVNVSQIPEPNVRYAKNYGQEALQLRAEALKKTKEVFGKLAK